VKLDPQCSLITVEVEIFKGRKSRIVRMALDTGATYLLVPRSVLEGVGYRQASARTKIGVTTASGTERVPFVTLQRVAVLGKSVSKVPAICHDLPPQSPVDGLLGLSFLRWFDIDLHFRKGRLDLRGPSRR
jgi:clan AA aspartic protease (TIGR02281 family)